MRHLEAALDYEIRQEELERKEHFAEWQLKLNNLLKKPIEIDGFLFDALIDAHFTRKGTHGDVEINSFEVQGLSIASGVSGNHLLHLDRPQLHMLEKSVYEKFETAAKEEAIKQASKSFDWIVEEFD